MIFPNQTRSPELNYLRLVSNLFHLIYYRCNWPNNNWFCHHSRFKEKNANEVEDSTYSVYKRFTLKLLIIVSLKRLNLLHLNLICIYLSLSKHSEGIIQATVFRVGVYDGGRVCTPIELLFWAGQLKVKCEFRTFDLLPLYRHPSVRSSAQ